MAITIAANLSKKVPIVGTDYSSQQASITITAEVSDLTQVAAEAQKLYRIAEAAVDAQLAGAPIEQPASSPAPKPTVQPSVADHPTQASQPYRNNGQRRGPAPSTESQLRFLRKLITQTGASLPGILEHHQIGSLELLTCKAAAELIDELKERVTA